MPWLFAGMLGLIIFVAFRNYLIGNKTYLFKDIGSDTLNSFYPQMVHIGGCIRRWTLPGWSFNQGMGQNVYPNSLGEPFTWILYLLNPDALPRGIALVEMLKLVTAGALFYGFLRLRGVGVFTATLIALSYAFCGTMIVGGGWRVFSTQAVHAALLLVACELLIQRRNVWLFPLAVALITAFNVFYGYLFGLLMLAYVAARYFGTARHDGWKLSRLLVAIAALGLIGLAISAVFSLPSALEMLESPRGHGPASQAGRLLGSPIFRLGNARYYASLALRSFNSDMLGTGSAFRGWTNYAEAPMHYCALLTLLLAPHVFVALSKRQRWLYGIIGGIAVFIQVVPWFRYSFWLFTGDYFRTLSLFFSIILLLYAARALDGILGKSGINVTLLIGTLVALLVLVYFPYYARGRTAEIVDGTLQAGVVLLLIAYTALLIALSRPRLRFYAQIGLLLTVGFELALFTDVSVNHRNVVTTTELRQKSGYNDYTKEALDIIRRQDAGFYRVEKNYSSSPAMNASMNDGKVQGYFGTSSYHSFNQMNYINFLAGLGVIDPKDANQTSWAPGLRGRPVLQTFASVRYFLFKGDYTADPFLTSTYTLLGTAGDLRILKNRNFIPLGFGLRQYIRASAHRALDPTQKDAALLHGFVVPDSAAPDYPQFSEWRSSSAQSPYGLDAYSADSHRCAENAVRGVTVSQNRIAGKFGSAWTQMLVFSIPFDAGWKATVDGSNVPLRRIDYGLTGLEVGAGEHAILLRYRSPMLTTGLLVSLLGVLALAGAGILSRILRRSSPAGRE